MSIAYSAHVVCGFRLAVEEVTKKQTKYATDTGKAYTVKVPSHKVAKVGGVTIVTTDGVDKDALIEGTMIEGLEIVGDGDPRCDCCLCNRWNVLGICTSIYDWEKIASKELNVSSVPAAVDTFAKKYDITPKWFLILSSGF